MPDVELAKLLIERYKGDRERYQETLRILNEGWRHFDYKPFDGLLEVTEDYRKSTLASIARLENLIARYESDLKGVT